MSSYSNGSLGIFRRTTNFARWRIALAACLAIGSYLVAAFAPSAAIAAGCSNEAFRTGPSALLPDCRAYEQATPVDKNGGGAEGALGVVKAASDGEAITFFSQAGVPGGVGAQEFPSFMSSRGSSEWSTHGLLPPQELGDKANIRGLSSNLKYAVTEVVKSGAAPEENGLASLLIENTENHGIETVVPYTEAEANAFILAGISEENGLVSRVFFEAKVPLVGSGSSLGIPRLFVWNRSSGKISLVGMPPEPESESAFTGSFAGPYNWVQGKLTEGGAFANYYIAETHAISENGDRAYFTARTSGQLFLRRGLTGNSPSTVHVSASQKTNGSSETKPAAFLAATPDGSQAFFTSHQELTNDANTGIEEQGNDLYMYDAETEKLTDLTAAEDAETETENGAEVQGMLGINEEGTVAYFVANGVLAENENFDGEKAQPGNCAILISAGGACNLYRYNGSGLTPRITFIMRFSGPSAKAEFRNGNEIRNWSPKSVSSNSLTTEPTARVSPDGSTLLFRSSQPLTGYENLGCSEQTMEGNSEERCPEFYLYSADSEDVICVSCNPSGTSPVGPPALRSEKIDAFVRGKSKGALPTMTRNLSREGSRVFFETPDALVPTDVNGDGGCEFSNGTIPNENNCQDVYEWEAQGTGSCAVATVPGGCLYLISTGQSRVGSYIADMDETGDNVFFFTESQLVPADGDQLVDIYDARVEGGLPSQHEQPPTTCVGEACQGSATPAPTEWQPNSSTLVGPPNSRPKKVKKKKTYQRKCKKAVKHCKSQHHSDQHTSRSTHADRGGVR